MNNDGSDLQALQEELEQFRTEKENIRKLVGQIGGSDTATRDKILNIFFIVALSTLFLMDVVRHILHIEVPIPTMFSLELGVLMVSIKIIWMVHKQAKVEHFQFWILNSIEFRLNDISKRMRKQEKQITAVQHAIEDDIKNSNNSRIL